MTAPGFEELPGVSALEAMREVAEGVTMIDVREQDEWDGGHAPNARLLPLSRLQDGISALPRDTRLLVVCHAGSRSLRATSILRSAGLDAVNVEGGMTAWVAGRGPVVVDSRAANPVED